MLGEDRDMRGLQIFSYRCINKKFMDRTSLVYDFKLKIVQCPCEASNVCLWSTLKESRKLRWLRPGSGAG